MESTGHNVKDAVEACELCIIGAGIAGYNALFSASRYLSPSDKVIMIDRRPHAGGMWNDTYSYVRLHQPHPMFTAGDIPWRLGREPAYLATRDEILDQFANCTGELQKRVALDQRFGCDYLGYTERVDAADGFPVRIEYAQVDNPSVKRTIKARKCVVAVGFRVPQNPPLTFSSKHVHSISPDSYDLLNGDIRRDAKPVWIAGGGKTAMDTALALLGSDAGRAVNLAVGRGTVFTSRDKSFPPGIGRWWRGNTSLGTFLDVARHFNGDNEADTLEYFCRHYGLRLNEQCRQFVFGVQSEAENDAIARGASSIVMDYLEDVIDRGEQTMLRFRSGTETPVERGAWIVNCTGYIMREPYPYEPYASPGGNVASVQPTSTIHFLSTFDAYFLVHLLYLGQLRTLPLYELDIQTLNQKDKDVLPFAGMVHLLYNVGLIAAATPSSVMTECGLNFDRWYPLPRQLLTYTNMRRHSARDSAHFRKTLDRIRTRFDVRCGPLPGIA